ncbi:MAG: hypothetical protein LBQ32_07460 [Burkholderiaceae bacterium]|jgi:hypothetical protein|nr:hypothetical protein [Burkholderiaceae bacterium]
MANTFQNRVLSKSLFGAAMLACALWGAQGTGAPVAVAPAAESPPHRQDTARRPIAIASRMMAHLPGPPRQRRI